MNNKTKAKRILNALEEEEYDSNSSDRAEILDIIIDVLDDCDMDDDS